MARKQSQWLAFGNGNHYVDRVHRPLQCLVFISPLLVIYQVGSALQSTQLNQAPQHVVAFVKILEFFRFFGAAGDYMPLLSVVVVLIFWHLARKDKLDVEPPLYVGMALESIAWALPVFVIGLALTQHFAANAAIPIGGKLPIIQEFILYIGAGVYEEFVFRLVAITFLNIILADMLSLKPTTAIPIAVLISSILFSSYHYLGEEQFNGNWNVFAFRTAAGIYFAALFIFRGFGITVGAHAVYDIMVGYYNHLHSVR